jgi:hypothetical protein
MAQYAVDSAAGAASIQVERDGNTNALVSVNYSTSNGTAIAGKLYLPASGTLTFLPGQAYSQQTFSVTILPNQSQSAVAATVNLLLTQPTGGATLGTNSSAILTINELPAPPPPPPPPPPPIDLNAPRLTSEQLILSGRAIAAIVLAFSKPMVVGRAQDLSNYGYFVYAAKPNGTFGGSSETYVAISSAVYSPAAQSVTITPSAPLSLNRFWRITVNSQTNTLLNNGLTSTSNNLLLGSDGKIGTPLVITFAAGKRLVYTDSGRNLVKLQLAKGGLLEVFRNFAGDAEAITLTGTIAKKTTLSGSVSRGLVGSGRTFLPPIIGAAGVRMKLKFPPFVLRPSSQIS